MATASRLDAPPSFASLRAGGAALFLDFDGTLVEIADAPDRIVVREGLSMQLRALSRQLEGRLAVVTGRAREDITSHLDLSGIAVAGSHGADIFDATGERLGEEAKGLPTATLDYLREAADRHGLMLETKPHGAALHYRQNPDAEPQALASAQEAAEEAGMAVKFGKCIVELVWPGIHKGRALATFMDAPPFQGAMPIFVGDDVTDEDGFSVASDMGGAGILIGAPRSSSARYRLDGVEELYAWLER
ncbi:trehalose-phosphatase [Sphingomicrobium sediminis]|uniref:Trehalose 6-phosphate phosphatase n=1 Tax=Sphingomicrobium sediminis TaxID=2950949 RepID=A0A9X2J2X5_9SPHN|nr:trehalose-phosphatase [Sphingomicrobium sediminis]MCM8556721.1 trehalose-phosphatase [Sphingomicrobium sediminis]